jgi:hypothetical protein
MVQNIKTVFTNSEYFDVCSKTHNKMYTKNQPLMEENGSSLAAAFKINWLAIDSLTSW